jgi:hypothetical protein
MRRILAYGFLYFPNTTSSIFLNFADFPHSPAKIFEKGLVRQLLSADFQGVIYGC